MDPLSYLQKSIPTNIDVIDNKFITGRKYRNSGNHQNLANAQSYLHQTQRKPRFSVAVSPKDPNFHSNINLNVPGVDQSIPAPPVITAYTGTNNAPPT